MRQGVGSAWEGGLCGDVIMNILGEKERVELGGVISEREVEEAVTKMSRGKAPGIA